MYDSTWRCESRGQLDVGGGGGNHKSFELFMCRFQPSTSRNRYIYDRITFIKVDTVHIYVNHASTCRYRCKWSKPTQQLLATYKMGNATVCGGSIDIWGRLLGSSGSSAWGRKGLLGVESDMTMKGAKSIFVSKLASLFGSLQTRFIRSEARRQREETLICTTLLPSQ